jgi:xanthine dehydrogenase YagR molybdenum-binding subunit
MSTTYLGQAVNRVDGVAKVTGAAKYAAEHHPPNLAYGFIVSSEIAVGAITRIDVSDALAVPGVLHVFTHENTPRLARANKTYQDEVAPEGAPFRPLHDATVRFSGQPIALVVADSFELARYAAGVLRIEYLRGEHATSLDAQRHAAQELKDHTPDPRGDASRAFDEAPVRVDVEYRAPVEHHNPMEMFGATVVYHDDGALTVYDKTQGAPNVHAYLCKVFNYATGRLRLLSPFVGGAFGSGLRPQYHVFLAVLAARELKRSVRVTMTRQQMFTFGHRPATWQSLELGAARDGTLRSLTHEVIAETSRFEQFTETVADWSGMLYRCDNVAFSHKLVPLDVYTPMDMRAPGAAWGLYALECAMDELAVALAMDPLELRLKNYAEKDQNEDTPFSSKELRECYRQGAERFGWARRNPVPRSTRRGHTLIGWGMATGVWEAMQMEASARAVLTADGMLRVSSATADIGPGTYTVMTQIAAETLGMPMEHVAFELGDSSLSKAPVEGGSFTVASVGSAVKLACEKVRRRLDEAKKKHGSRAVSMTDIMREASLDTIDEKATARPSKKREERAHYAHTAVFAEVEVDEDFGTVRVTRVVSAVAAGRILNPKTARSQIVGGIVWGIGMALEEESLLDPRFARFVNTTLSEYHVPVNADVPAIDIQLIEEQDELVSPVGAKGAGEIGITGAAAAVCNAVYHATGKRVRELPILLDKLL